VRPRTVSCSTPLAKLLDARSGGRSFAFLYITNKCTLTCSHCSFCSSPRCRGTELEKNLLLSLLDELRGVHDITITGGEPMLHPDFAAIVSHAAAAASVVYVMTNGISLAGKKELSRLAHAGDGAALKIILRAALNELPENIHLFFPLDSFHLRAFRPFGFLLRCLAELASEWNGKINKPYIGFLSNEVSAEKSARLIQQFKAGPYSHIGTASFAPWRSARNIRGWYLRHRLNQLPFPGGVYINYKGIYLNEASLLLDLREAVETPLKIGLPVEASTKNSGLLRRYRNALDRLRM
jgi:hypothetical protein